MNIMSMESIFLLLSGVILVAGVLYWFWSHIQLTQKKVQLLENAVFELRGMMTAPGGPPPSSSGSGGIDPSSPSPSLPVYDDLPDDDWEQEESGNGELADVHNMRSTPLMDINSTHHGVYVSRENDDLMPGGAPSMHVSEIVEGEEDKKEEFRELFVAQEAATPVRTPESLDAMPVKELRRLAEQRGIAGAADMRKKEILAALRKQVAPAGEVAVQKTLDLTVEEAPVEESATAEVEAEILE